jgi:hypothetical protein
MKLILISGLENQTVTVISKHTGVYIIQNIVESQNWQKF